MNHFFSEISAIRNNALGYISHFDFDQQGTKLTLNSDRSPYARCFLIYIYHLLRQDLPISNDILSAYIIHDLKRIRSCTSNCKSKSYLQLLCFSLSALHLLGNDFTEVKSLVVEQLTDDPIKHLKSIGTFEGKAQTGNHAMFVAILLLTAIEKFDLDYRLVLDDWIRLHKLHFNSQCFFGDNNYLTHLQFQNGYHQYEIFEYLGEQPQCILTAISAILKIVDSRGHFAPYPGGGGCYDYDAIHILTSISNSEFDSEIRDVLKKHLLSLFDEQRPDGGFCESSLNFPATGKLFPTIRHLFDSFPNPSMFYERLFFIFALSKKRNSLINTHWTKYSRGWSESDLWDTYFRLLSIARIDNFLNYNNAFDWGFINFPGIGYHGSFFHKK